MQPLRVLHASPTWFDLQSVVGGGERWVHNIMSAVHVGAPEIRQAMVTIGAKNSLEFGHGFCIRILANQRQSKAPMDGLSSALWTEFASFDVIHVHQSLTDFGAYACSIAASLGKTLVVTDLGGGNNPIMVNGGLALAHGVVSISAYANNMLDRAVSAPAFILSGPVDTDKFVPALEEPTKAAVICVSRVMPHKGIDRIVRALPPELKLRVVGKVYHEDYRRLLGELAVGKDVEFIDDADDARLVDLYQCSTLFAQASRVRDIYGTVNQKTELMGLTTLEAMSTGLPVVVSADGGALPELVTDRDFGEVFETDDQLTAILRSHAAGAWPPKGARVKARHHVEQTSSLRAYGGRLASFYHYVHGSNANCAF